jgi:pimeloyl-ACP methyl ester carboxylesterase
MKLYTTTIGDGPKQAALVHGLTGNGETWFELAPWIAEHGYTVTLVDQRGHGQSGRASSYGAAELADDLVETLPRGMDLVAGHSLGGRTLILAAERLQPKKAVYFDPGWVIPDDLVLALPLRDDGTLIGVDEFLELFPGRTREQAEQALRSMAAFDPTVIEAPNVPLASIDPPEHPVVPSLVLAADPSPLVPPALQERLIAGGYVVRVVPGGQHDLHVDNLEETKQALEDWL